MNNNHSDERPPPYAPYESAKPESIKLEQVKVEEKSKVRTVIPFLFYDIDITDFPRIYFVSNSVSDRTDINRIV